MLSLLWKALAGLATLFGAAVVARTYSESPQHPVATSTAPRARKKEQEQQPGPQPLRPGWHRAHPTTLPRPTYWPAVLALGVAFIMWGLVSNLFVLGTGLLLFIVAVIGWIRELLHE